MQNEYFVPHYIVAEVEGMGYRVHTSMTASIKTWNSWYTGTTPFYKDEFVTLEGGGGTRDRLSIRPARRVPRMGIADPQRRHDHIVRRRGGEHVAAAVHRGAGVRVLRPIVHREDHGARHRSVGAVVRRPRRAHDDQGAPLRRADGHAAVVGRRGNHGVRVRNAGDRQRQARRPAHHARLRRGHGHLPHPHEAMARRRKGR